MNGYGRWNRISGCRIAQGPERPGQAAVVRWKRFRVSRLSLHFPSPHEPRQRSLSTVDGQMRSQTKFDLAGSRAKLGDAHLKCCMQMYYALALITRGSVRTLIRSVEETNGAEAWRLIRSRYAPDTQNRPYILMQKTMMPAKPLCDHTEGFESGLRFWELDVGERERASRTALAGSQVHSDDEYGPDFSWKQPAVGYIRQQYSSSCSSVAMVLLFPKLWSKSDRVSWKWNRCG